MAKSRFYNDYLFIALSIVYLVFCPLLTSTSAQDTDSLKGSKIQLENGGADTLRAKILKMIARGDSLSAAGEFAQADSVCIAALAVTDSSFEPDDTLSVRCLDCRVAALRSMQRLEEAVPLAQHTLADLLPRLKEYGDF